MTNPITTEESEATAAVLLAFMDACRRGDGTAAHDLLVKDWRAATSPATVVQTFLAHVGWDVPTLGGVVLRWFDDESVVAASARSSSDAGIIVWIRPKAQPLVPFVAIPEGGAWRVSPNPLLKMSPEDAMMMLGMVSDGDRRS